MKNEVLIKASALNIAYGEKTAVKNLSFELRRGEILCLAGESGSGKSTVLKALISSPDVKILSGSLEMEGTDVLALPEKKRRALCSQKLGVVFQSPGAAFNPIRPYGKQLIETLKSHGKYDKDTFLKRVTEAFTKVDLKDAEKLLKQCPYALSGGMNQRMALALAMLLEQEILICDEPTSALDATIQLQVAQELKKLRDVNGISQIIVTHNLAMAGFLANRIGIVHQGRLVEMGAAQEILRSPKEAYTKSLIAAIPKLKGGAL